MLWSSRVVMIFFLIALPVLEHCKIRLGLIKLQLLMKLKIGWLIGWGAAPLVGGEHKASPLPQTAKRAPKANLQSS